MKRLLFWMVMVLGLTGGGTVAAESQILVYVDHGGDESGQACTLGGSADCSLRSAIEMVNGAAGNSHSILFLGDLTIDLDSALPTITQDNVTITTVAIRRL